MLSRQLQQMQSDKDIPGISCGLVDNNVFEWEVMLMISDDVKLYGGMEVSHYRAPNPAYNPGLGCDSGSVLIILFMNVPNLSSI